MKDKAKAKRAYEVFQNIFAVVKIIVSTFAAIAGCLGFVWYQFSNKTRVPTIPDAIEWCTTNPELVTSMVICCIIAFFFLSFLILIGVEKLVGKMLGVAQPAEL